MFNNQGGFGDRGGWRGNYSRGSGGNRGNFINQSGNGRGMPWVGSRDMTFNGPFRGSRNNRGPFQNRGTNFRGRGTRRGGSNWSLGDQMLQNMGQSNYQGCGPEGNYSAIKPHAEFPSQPPISSPLTSSNQNKSSEQLHQSPDISSSTTFSVPLEVPNHPNVDSSPMSSEPLSSTYCANTSSQSGVTKCEPCGVSLVGSEVSYAYFVPKTFYVPLNKY